MIMFSEHEIESYGRIHRMETGISCWCGETHNPQPYVEPIPAEELAELNPDLDQRGLARLQAFEQLLAEDDLACGYQDPEE